MTKVALATTMLMAVTLIPTNNSYRNISISGDLLGSATIKGTKQKGEDTGNVTEIDANMKGNSDFSGKGVYFRIKNNTGTDTPLTLKINSTNGTIIAPTTNVKQSYFDADGKEVEGIAPREWGNYMMLPAHFDGYIYMDYATQMSKIMGSEEFNAASIWRVYVEYSGHYDSYANFTIGDIFTDTKQVLDTSAIDSTSFSKVFINQVPEYQSITQNPRSVDTYIPEGDLLGGLRVKHSDVTYAGFMVKFKELTDLSDGIYVRIKNLSKTSSWVMVHVASDHFGNRSVLKENTEIKLYKKDGSLDSTKTINDVCYFELPANFDGFIGLNKDNLKGDTNWAGSNYNIKTSNAIYFEAENLNIEVGDIFNKSVRPFDGSEIYASEIPSYFESWTGCTYEVLEGSKPVPVQLFDYSTITYNGELENGVKITSNKNPNSSIFSSVTANFKETINLSEGEAISIAFSGIGSYAFQLEFVDNEGNIMQLPSKKDGATKPIHFIKDKKATSMNHTNGDENTIHTIEGEGTIVIQKDFLVAKKGKTFSWNNVKGFNVNCHTFYDDKLNISFGDIGTVSQETKKETIVYKATDHEFDGVYKASDKYMKFSKIKTILPSAWIGDVKIIDSLNYKDDETLKQNINYDPNDNVCSFNKQDDGMFVHIGPFETGHAYGNYMCLGLFDKGATNDRKQAYRMNGETKEYAKGVTFYVENLSFKEIGLTLQFEEKIPGKTNKERWAVLGYPVMYYAYDVEKDTDYLMYSKSDQVQVPVGFKGYIRVPFESYGVPAWNVGQPGVDQILDLDNFTGDFFLTSDNTRFEDLEFFIKNVGLYFNETRKGNFLSKENTIKANMGLGE